MLHGAGGSGLPVRRSGRAGCTMPAAVAAPANEVCSVGLPGSLQEEQPPGRASRRYDTTRRAELLGWPDVAGGDVGARDDKGSPA